MCSRRTSICVLTAVLGVSTVVGAALLAGCNSSDLDERGQLVRNAAEYLWAQQGEDGGWHSETHGLLRGGETWTPFVAHYLFQVPDSIYAATPSRREHALQFIREHVTDTGILGISDPTVLEYPNYATSYALRVLRRWGAPSDSVLIQKMRRYLLGQQYDESRGIAAEHPAYGAWGFGETSMPVGEVGHIDLSHTRRVLEALRSAGARGEHGLRARRFLAMLQKHPGDSRPQPGALAGDRHPAYDGGFYASTVTVGLNKGGAVVDSLGLAYYPSYSTTTCDGVLALLAAGVPPDDERVLRATAWLSGHTNLTFVEGIPDNPSQWQHVMFYYHLLVRSEANVALGIGGTWPDDMLALLESRVGADGSFSNPDGAPNKEDDPILATTMVVGTLLNAL